MFVICSVENVKEMLKKMYVGVVFRKKEEVAKSGYVSKSEKRNEKVLIDTRRESTLIQGVKTNNTCNTNTTSTIRKR
jgi:hypothetical protein